MTPDTLRIGDAERNQVAEELKRHCADGRLTLDEYSERLDEVFAARTYADLARALRDLPGPPPLTRRAAVGPDLRWRPRHAPRALKLIAVLLLVWALTGGGGFFFPALPLLLVGFCLLRRADRERSRLRHAPPDESEIRV